MTTPIAGTISMQDIATEFGGDLPHSIDEYYGSGVAVPTSGPIDFDSLRGRSTNIAEFDLRRTDTPTGLNYIPGQSMLMTEQANDGYRTAGDASGRVYELHTNNEFTGDVLFETSVQVTNSCGDPSLAISTDIGNAYWYWGPHWSRISLTFNCTLPYLYGTSSANTNVGTNIPSYGLGTYYTMHLHHQPSMSRTRAWVTQGYHDWENETSNRIGNIVETPNNYGTFAAIGCGVASDFDGANTSASSTNFRRLRVNVGY